METISSLAFVYPTATKSRRHGPQGYRDLQSFRPWLRDEFSFRCVYCLAREQWGRVYGEYDVEHFVPVANSSFTHLEYDNLVYACHSCNRRKGVAAIPDPLEYFTLQSVGILPNGQLIGRSLPAKAIIAKVGLNSPAMVRWRLMWIRIVEMASTVDSELFFELLRYPDDLPDLKSLSPVTNSRPKGIERSFHVLRSEGELEKTYLM